MSSEADVILLNLRVSVCLCLCDSVKKTHHKVTTEVIKNNNKTHLSAVY